MISFPDYDHLPLLAVINYTLVKLPKKNYSQSARFCIVHPPMLEGTKTLRTDPRVVDHAENEYRRAHVRRWGVFEI